MPFLADLVRRLLTSVALRYVLLLVSAVVFPFTLRHPVLTVGFLILVVAVAYLLWAYRRRP